MYIYSSSTPLNGLNWGSNVSTVSTTIAAPIFYEVKSELLTNSEELNALYNTSGFSFVSKRLKDQGEDLSVTCLTTNGGSSLFGSPNYD